MSKKTKRNGYFFGEADDDRDSGSRHNSHSLDPRVEAFVGTFTYVEDITLAEEFFMIAKLRLMFNAFPFKDSDPIDAILIQLKNNGFFLRVDAMDKMGIPVRRINRELLTPNTHYTE